MNKRTTVIVKKLSFDDDFKPTVEPGIYTALIEEFPKNGKILDVMTTPVGIFIAIEAELTDTGVIFTNETDLIMVMNEVKFSKTPEFDAWFEDRMAKLHEEGSTGVVIKPIRDEYEFIKHDFIFKKSFYIHSYKFSQFDLQV